MPFFAPYVSSRKIAFRRFRKIYIYNAVDEVLFHLTNNPTEFVVPIFPSSSALEYLALIRLIFRRHLTSEEKRQESSRQRSDGEEAESCRR